MTGRRTILFAVILASWFGLGGVIRGGGQELAPTSQTAEVCAPMAAGRGAFRARRYREAAALFAAAAKAAEAGTGACPREALYDQARALERLGDLGVAEGALRRYLAGGDHFARALYLLGSILQRENKAKESLEIFTRAAAQKAPTAEELRIVALDYVLLDDYVDAVGWLRRAVEADPRNLLAWYDLGRAQMHEGDFVNAEQSFKRTLLLDPGNVKALDNLGLSYEGQNRTEEAVTAYQRAIAAQRAVDQPSEQPLLNLGTLLNTRNRSAEAVGLLQRTVEIAPKCSHCLEELARAYEFTRQQDLAIGTMQRAIMLDGSNPRLHFQMGQMYRRAGRATDADHEFKVSSALYGRHSTPIEQ